MIKNQALVVMWGILLFIPFLGTVHLFDWDEINFAESAREMLVTGDFFRIQINYQPFWEKPPLFFWIQSASMYLFGVNEFAARFPNAVCGIITLLTIFTIGKKYFSTRFAVLWILFMTGSFTPLLYFKSGIIDPFFNLFIFLSLFQMYLSVTTETMRKKNIHTALAAVFCGLAIITKGPVALLIILLCGSVYFIYNRFRIFWSFSQILNGAVILVLFCSVAMFNEMIKTHPDGIYSFFVYQFDLLTKSVAGHGEPWYFHPVVLLIGAFPASLFAIQGFYMRVPALDDNQKKLRLFMGILFWVVLVLFSIVKTKIVHYSSLCYLPLTFTAAFAVEYHVLQKSTFGSRLTLGIVILGSVIGFLLTLAPLSDHFVPYVIPYINDPFAIASLNIPSPWNGYEFVNGLFILGAVVWYYFTLRRGGEVFRATCAFLAVLSVSIVLYLAIVVPKIEAYSQRPAISFYKGLKGKNCYVETLGFKSYAQYFYSSVMPQPHSGYSDIVWLLTGNIDKPAYFVVKITDLEDYNKFHFREVDRRGGFVLLMRDIQTAQEK